MSKYLSEINAKKTFKSLLRNSKDENVTFSNSRLIIAVLFLLEMIQNTF